MEMTKKRFELCFRASFEMPYSIMQISAHVLEMFDKKCRASKSYKKFSHPTYRRCHFVGFFSCDVIEGKRKRTLNLIEIQNSVVLENKSRFFITFALLYTL